MSSSAPEAWTTGQQICQECLGLNVRQHRELFDACLCCSPASVSWEVFVVHLVKTAQAWKQNVCTVIITRAACTYCIDSLAAIRKMLRVW